MVGNQYLKLEVQKDDMPVKTRPPPVSTVIELPETEMPKAAKAGETKSTKLTSAVRNNIVVRLGRGSSVPVPLFAEGKSR